MPQIAGGINEFDEVASERGQEMDSSDNDVPHGVGGRTRISEVENLAGLSESEGASNNATLPRGTARRTEDEREGSETDFKARDAPLRRPSNDDQDDGLPLRVPTDDDDVNNANDFNVDVASLDMDFQTAFLIGEDKSSPRDDLIPERRGRDARTSGDDTAGAFLPRHFSVSEEDLEVVGGVQHQLPQKPHGDRCKTRGRGNEQIVRETRLRNLKPRAGSQVSLPTDGRDPYENKSQRIGRSLIL